MIKTGAAFAAAVTILSSGALAQTNLASITPGIYTVTTEYTALTDGPSGICAGSGLAVGGFTTGIATVLGSKKTIQSVVPQPATASPYQVNNLTCNYSALPAIGLSVLGADGVTLTPAKSVAYTGTVTCTASSVASLGGGPATYTVSGGTSTIGSFLPKGSKFGGVSTNVLLANSFKITSSNVTVSLLSPVALGPICTLSTDSLFVRTGT